MKSAIYARYSSDNQREESVEGRICDCRAYAEYNGIEIVDEYIDKAFSAQIDANGLRPVIFKLTATDEESEIDYTPVR